MKAAVLTEKYKLEIWDIPTPEIDDHQVLIRLKACAICNATDTKFYKGIHSLSSFPAIIGHEGAGVIEAVGKGITKFKVGDRVIGGRFPATDKLASWWGQYCEYVVGSEDTLTEIPEGVTIEEATLSIMLGEALNACNIGDIRTGDNVLILGAGAVGMSLLSILKNTLAYRIFVLDISEEKLSQATKLGADFVLNAKDENLIEKINELTEGKGINKLFEAVGSQATYNLAFDMIGKGGVVVPFGIIEGAMEIPFRTLYSKQAQIKWCQSAGFNREENLKTVLGMMKKGRIDTGALITNKFSLEDINKGFASILEGKENRVLIQLG